MFQAGEKVGPHEIRASMICSLASLQKESTRPDHWTKKAFGNFCDFVVVEQAERKVTLTMSRNDLTVEFRLLEESTSQRDTGGIPRLMESAEVHDMLDRLFHETVGYSVNKKSSKGEQHVVTIQSPLRRNLVYHVELVGAEFVRNEHKLLKKYSKDWVDVFQKYADEIIKDTTTPRQYRYVKSKLSFTRTVADLDDSFRVLLIRDANVLQKHSSIEHVIYREEIDVNEAQFQAVYRWLREHSSETADQSEAFIKAYVGEVISKETRVAIAGVESYENGVCAICFKLPPFVSSWEPRTFHFEIVLPMLCEAKHFPFHLAEETCGISFHLDYSTLDDDDTPKSPIAVPFARSIQGHDRPTVVQEPLSIRMDFDSHSLAAGEGVHFIWK
jgi:hypothetical protein